MSDPNKELDDFFQDVIAHGEFSQQAKEAFRNNISKWITALREQQYVYTPKDIVQESLEQVGMPPNLVKACLIKSGKGN